MLKYIDYLNEASRYYELLDENEFGKIADKFPDVNISFNDYEFSDENLEIYILNKILEEERFDNVWVDYIGDDGVELYSDDYVSPESLDELEELLSRYGYNFINRDDLELDYNAHKSAQDKLDLHRRATLILDNMSNSELEAFIEEYAN